MKRIQLLNEYEVILSETILLQDMLAFENMNQNTDPSTNPEIECRCRRLCGRKTCDRRNDISGSDGQSSTQPH